LHEREREVNLKIYDSKTENSIRCTCNLIALIDEWIVAPLGIPSFQSRLSSQGDNGRLLDTNANVPKSECDRGSPNLLRCRRRMDAPNGGRATWVTSQEDAPQRRQAVLWYPSSRRRTSQDYAGTKRGWQVRNGGWEQRRFCRVAGLLYWHLNCANKPRRGRKAESSACGCTRGERAVDPVPAAKIWLKRVRRWVPVDKQ